MRDFKKLVVWEKSHQLALDVYRVTAVFPTAELYGLISQLRRAASSIPANIAEGCGRDSDTELARFLRIAMGSGNEVEYYALLARDLGYLEEAEYAPLLNQTLEAKRMLAGFLTRLKPPALQPEA